MTNDEDLMIEQIIAKGGPKHLAYRNKYAIASLHTALDNRLISKWVVDEIAKLTDPDTGIPLADLQQQVLDSVIADSDNLKRVAQKVNEARIKWEKERI